MAREEVKFPVFLFLGFACVRESETALDSLVDTNPCGFADPGIVNPRMVTPILLEPGSKRS